MLSRIDEFIESAYGTSCRHGFHDDDLSFAHQMMLVIGEVGEMVEADRRCRRANRKRFEKDYEKYPNLFVEGFERYIKDTVEDELADVCIRLFDMCGCFDISPEIYYDDDVRGCWDLCFGKKDFCELSYDLVLLLCKGEDNVDDLDALGLDFGCVLVFIQCLANKLGIDLDKHIELKMRYNESRGYKHGKRY